MSVANSTKPSTESIPEDEEISEEAKQASLQKQLEDLNEQTKKAFENTFDISEDFNY